MLRDEVIYEKGTEVFIFKYVRGFKELKIDEFIMGEVVTSKMSDDLSFHGSSYYVMNYTVLGKDCNVYFGNMEYPTQGNSFFMTKDMYIKHWIDREKKNNEKIEEIRDANKTIERLIYLVNNSDIKTIEKDNVQKIRK